MTKLGKMARASVGAKAWSAMCAAEFDKVIARFPLSKPTEAEVGSRGTHLISSAFGGMRAGPGTGGIRAGGATTRSPASAPAAPAPAAVFTGTYHTASPPSIAASAAPTADLSLLPLLLLPLLLSSSSSLSQLPLPL